MATCSGSGGGYERKDVLKQHRGLQEETAAALGLGYTFIGGLKWDHSPYPQLNLLHSMTQAIIMEMN